MTRRLLSGLVFIGLSVTACQPAQIDLPTGIDALAQPCYQELLQGHPDQSPQLEPPKPMEDGTFLISWRLAANQYGSCKVDSKGNVLLLTSSQVEGP